MDMVGKGEAPDPRVSSEIAYELVKLATKESEHGYKAFWINGHAEAVRFDENYRSNALLVARERVRLEAPNKWHVGASHGSVVGELKRVDDLDADNEFVVVPPVGAARVRCTFPEHLRKEMGGYLFTTVRVTGLLHYGEEGPFPYMVEATDIEQMRPRRRSFAELRGVFAQRARPTNDWGTLLNG